MIPCRKRWILLPAWFAQEHICGGVSLYRTGLGIFTCPENVEERIKKPENLPFLYVIHIRLRLFPIFDRISAQPRIRSGRKSATKGRMVFCQAGQYQQLLLLDETGSVVSRDIAHILKVLRCTKDEPIIPLDARHNTVVSRTKAMFAHEAAQRRIEQQHTISLTNAQRYVLRELRTQYGLVSDEDLKAQINLMEQTFRRSLTRTLASELNAIKRAELTGMPLLQELTQLYTRYNLDQQRAQTQREDDAALPYIVCSELLV